MSRLWWAAPIKVQQKQIIYIHWWLTLVACPYSSSPRKKKGILTIKTQETGTPSTKLASPLPAGTFESMIFLFPQVRYVSFRAFSPPTPPTTSPTTSCGPSSPPSWDLHHYAPTTAAPGIFRWAAGVRPSSGWWDPCW